MNRVKVYAQIIAVRAGKLTQLGASPAAKSHTREIHDLLEDYASLADELAGNFDEYESYETNHRFPVPDLRKTLTKLGPQLEQWAAVLKGLPANDGYDFARTTALDAQDSLQDAYKELVAHQTTWFRAKHEDDVQKPQPVSDPARK